MTDDARVRLLLSNAPQLNACVRACVLSFLSVFLHSRGEVEQSRVVC